MVTTSPPKDKTDRPLDWLKQAFFYAVEQVSGQRCVKQYLQRQHLWPPDTPVHIIAIGKAATAMALGACNDPDTALQTGLLISASQYGHTTRLPSPFTQITGNHPVPGRQSLLAGRTLLKFIQDLPDRAQVLLLISGGSSAMVECLPAGLSLETLQRANQWLLHSGLDIHAMNALRKRLSNIKGGRLAHYLHRQQTHCLMISDVINDDPACIGSGLVNPSPSLSHPIIPDWLTQALNDTDTMAPPTLDDTCLKTITTHIITNNLQARKAVRHYAEPFGLHTTLHTELLTKDIHTVADGIAATLQNSPPGLHIWGGEPTVQLPDTPGTGGRNQALALEVARRIAGLPGIYFLSAGTDGIDGNSSAAGAAVEGDTLQRAAQTGLDVEKYRKTADSGTFFAHTGEAIQCGHTDTNVMDLMLGLKI